MLRTLLYLLPLALLACHLDDSRAPEASPPAVAPAFQAFSQQFDSLRLAPGDTLDAQELLFGEIARLRGEAGGIRLAPSEMQQIIPAELLEKAAFDSLESYYAIGQFPYTAHKDAFLLGSYADPQRYSTHLFLYDKRYQAFTHTQSLGYKMGGGIFLSERQSWLCDLNGDHILDVLYRRDEALNSDDPREAYFERELRAEIWDGLRFVRMQAAPQQAQAWDSILVVQGYE